jgi:hypothetical protein
MPPAILLLLSICAAAAAAGSTSVRTHTASIPDFIGINHIQVSVPILCPFHA